MWEYSRWVGNTCHPADRVLSGFLPLPPGITLATVLAPSGYGTAWHQQSWENRSCLLLNATQDRRIIQAGGSSGGLYSNLLLQAGSAV